MSPQCDTIVKFSPWSIWRGYDDRNLWAIWNTIYRFKSLMRFELLSTTHNVICLFPQDKGIRETPNHSTNLVKSSASYLFSLSPLCRPRLPEPRRVLLTLSLSAYLCRNTQTPQGELPRFLPYRAFGYCTYICSRRLYCEPGSDEWTPQDRSTTYRGIWAPDAWSRDPGVVLAKPLRPCDFYFSRADKLKRVAE